MWDFALLVSRIRIRYSAPVDPDVLDLLKNRRSPTTFDPTPVAPDLLACLFEAARRAPSSYNDQPWRFIVATIDKPEEHARLLGCLMPANQEWAKRAPVLILTAIKRTSDRTGKPNRCAEHDLGLAVMSLVVQAAALGLATHQMAGVDLEKARAAYAIPEGFDPFTVVAVGPAGEAPLRPRRSLGEIVFSSSWGAANSFNSASTRS